MKVTIIHGIEDWGALYIDGRKKFQASTLDAWDVLLAVQEAGRPITALQSRTMNKNADRVVQDVGEFPETLELLAEWEADES